MVYRHIGQWGSGVMLKAVWAGWRSRPGGRFSSGVLFWFPFALREAGKKSLRKNMGQRVSEYKQEAVKVRPGGLGGDSP